MVSAPTSYPSSSSTKEHRPPPLAFRNTTWGCDEDDGLHEPLPVFHRSASVNSAKTSSNADGCLYPRRGSIAHLPDIRDVTYTRMATRAESLGVNAPDRQDVYKYADKELPAPPPSARKVHVLRRKPGRTLDVCSDCSERFETSDGSEDRWIEEYERRSRTHVESLRKPAADYSRIEGFFAGRQHDDSVHRKGASSKSGASKELNQGSFADRMRVGHMIIGHIARRKPRGRERS